MFDQPQVPISQCTLSQFNTLRAINRIFTRLLYFDTSPLLFVISENTCKSLLLLFNIFTIVR